MPKLKRMGVINLTPNSFSDGGELSSLLALQNRIQSYGPIHALDVGAESTAPKNASISWEEEWARIEPYLGYLKSLDVLISIDTYHPETIFKVAPHFKELIWNDVSGKFDHHVDKFLKMNPRHQYVLCHNLAPSRESAGTHIDYISSAKNTFFLEELVSFFKPNRYPQVIFDPCLGFSKTYEQNWFILDHFETLQRICGHSRWMIGISRKTFLRKRFDLDISQKNELDIVHAEYIRKMSAPLTGEVWIRTHRPELL